MKKLLSIIMLLSLAGSLCAMEDQWEEKEEKKQSENSTIMTEVTWSFLKGLPSDVALSIVSYLTLKERLHVLAGLLFEIKRHKENHPLFNREELVKYLLKANDRKSKSEENGKKLFDCCNKFHRGMPNNAKELQEAIQLINRGADVNFQSNDSPLSIAAVIGCFTIVKRLLDMGADPNIKDDEGRTPLHSAYGKNVAQALLQAGANPNHTDINGNTPLHYGHLEVIQVLLDAKADPNIQNCDGNTPLHTLAQRGNSRIFKTLLTRGADPYIKNNNDETVFDKVNSKLKRIPALRDELEDILKNYSRYTK